MKKLIFSLLITAMVILQACKDDDATPAAPAEINVTYSGGEGPVSVANGGTYDFGTTFGGGSISQTFTIENLGESTLTLTGDALVSISSGTRFSVTSQPSGSSIAPGESVEFTVLFNPGNDEGTTIQNYGSFTIESNDGEEGDYTVDLIGTWQPIIIGF